MDTDNDLITVILLSVILRDCAQSTTGTTIPDIG
jgi:hypothetical protein